MIFNVINSKTNKNVITLTSVSQINTKTNKSENLTISLTLWSVKHSYCNVAHVCAFLRFTTQECARLFITHKMNNIYALHI